MPGQGPSAGAFYQFRRAGELSLVVQQNKLVDAFSWDLSYSVYGQSELMAVAEAEFAPFFHKAATGDHTPSGATFEMASAFFLAELYELSDGHTGSGWDRLCRFAIGGQTGGRDVICFLS
jgi:hypothetical protein